MNDKLSIEEYIKYFKEVVDKSQWPESFKQGCKHVLGCLEMKMLEYNDWNEAIEAAAKIVDQANLNGPYNAIACAPEIRKLKKEK